MACQVTTETCLECEEPTSVDMESEAKHWEASKEHATVETDKDLRMGHRSGKLAAGRRGEPKELARRDCRSRRRLAAACRKVSRHAEVAWRKRNSITKYWTTDKVEQEGWRARMLRRALRSPNYGPHWRVQLRT
jgi:Ni/Co efflux regulator RcnB